jgi:NAD(P)-dependent dehydrogenase (short-subunit alcohol dehydrogenase family)
MTLTGLITGASTGIGRATAARLAAEGWQVFATVRRAEDAPSAPVIALIADVTEPSTLAATREKLVQHLAGAPLGALVLNAGIATAGPLLHQPLDEIRATLEVNMLGAIASVQAFAPLMQCGGRIVAISSVSGKFAAPFVGAYAASKHALEAACDSLRRELMIHGIDVIVIEPGPIATPIWRKSLPAIDYAATAYGEVAARVPDFIAESEAKALPVERAADAVMLALTAKRPRTRYVVTRNKLLNFVLPRLLPDRVMDRLIAAKLGLQRKP